MTEITFYIFSALILISAVMVISLRNPVHSVLFLIFAFFNASALFILIGAEYIAMILLIVYVGAVAVLFLFVVMMIDTNDARKKETFFSSLPLAFTLSVIIFLEIYWAFDRSSSYLKSYPLKDPDLSNVQRIGMVLYTEYALQFQISGLILLVAMMGAILLTLRHSKSVKRQSIPEQIARTRSQSISLVDVKLNEGVELK